MNTNSYVNYGVTTLMIEVESVIKKGLNNILKDYIDRFEILENTHKQIMLLPSVLDELNRNNNNNNNNNNINFNRLKSEETDDCEDDKPIFVSIAEMTQELIKEEVSIFENKVSKLEKKCDSFMPLFESIMKSINKLDEDIRFIKNKSSNSMDTEKKEENIKLQIEEKEEVEVENTSVDEENTSVDEENTSVDEENTSVDEEVEVENTNVYEEVEVENTNVVEEVISVVEEVEVENTSVVEEVDVENTSVDEKADVENTSVDEALLSVETENEEDEDDDEEEELTEIEIDDVTYCTNNEENGFIYELSEDGEAGEKVGYFKESEAFFYADEK